jgi:hypothetical protein
MEGLCHRQNIGFNYSAVEAAMRYLRERSSDNLKALVELPGAKLAFKHYRWSSMDPHITPEDFWKKQLDVIPFVKKIEASIIDIESYLKTRKQSKWLDEVLRYLPRNHVFNTTVYMIVGYDNIVLNEDVALNLNSVLFHKDRKESIYYLIHELAHAGYLRYHRMPDLTFPGKGSELSAIIEFLTHLEGMGVISSMRLRIKENGFLSDDYKVLRNEKKRIKRVRDYFNALSKFKREPDRKIDKARDFEVYNQFSRSPQRLWYITGCHMAQTIETAFGIERVRELVLKGSSDFFKTYLETENPSRLEPSI